jgi:hypothetical protein
MRNWIDKFSGCNVEGQYRIKLVYFILNKKIFCGYKDTSLTQNWMDIFSGCNVEGEYRIKLVYFNSNKKYFIYKHASLMPITINF